MSELSPISLAESKRLIALESVISKGISSFIEVGNALAEVRDSKLYKSEHKTFEDYCREKWGMSKAYSYRFISSAETASNLSPMGDKPTSERQVRPLTKLDSPAQQQKAWTRATEIAKEEGKEQPAARHVEQAVNERIRPIVAPALSDKQQKDVGEAEKDSETLWLLKSYWKKAKKNEREDFRQWIKSH